MGVQIKMAKMEAMGEIVNLEAEVAGARAEMVATAPQAKVVMAVMEEMQNELTRFIADQGASSAPDLFCSLSSGVPALVTSPATG
jgi:hypothetical protein